MDFGVHPAEPKPRIDRLSEGGVEGVEEGQFIRGDAEEGHCPSRPVQIHSYFIEAGWDGYSSACASVPGLVAIFVAI